MCLFLVAQQACSTYHNCRELHAPDVREGFPEQINGLSMLDSKAI